jgi:hypothetical protein
MKLIIFTFITLICSSDAKAATAKLKIGHRDTRQVAVLDIIPAQLQAVTEQAFAKQGYTHIKVAGLDISDNVLNPQYFASMEITITFMEPGVFGQQKVSFLYPIKYDPFTNSYYGDHNGPQLIESGGGSKNPDNNFCVARNCVGCKTLKDMDGKTTGCTLCLPVNTETPFECTVINTAGMGAGRIINALGGLLRGLISLI